MIDDRRIDSDAVRQTPTRRSKGARHNTVPPTWPRLDAGASLKFPEFSIVGTIRRQVPAVIGRREIVPSCPFRSDLRCRASGKHQIQLNAKVEFKGRRRDEDALLTVLGPNSAERSPLLGFATIPNRFPR